jgi:hypothetical protein
MNGTPDERWLCQPVAANTVQKSAGLLRKKWQLGKS